MRKNLALASTAVVLAVSLAAPAFVAAKSDSKLDEFRAHLPIHVHDDGHGSALVTSPTGLAPAQIRAAYNLPSSGGSGTIAIIDAYDNPNAESDLDKFDAQYGLPSCTTANGCFQKHAMIAGLKANSGWALEESLDVQWAHAIAPTAQILLVEAKSTSGTDLLAAVDYARNRADVTAVSMSWGGAEFSTENSYDGHFTSAYGASFFVASGDSGAGASWPSSSPNVTSVGGTSLSFNSNGTLASETGWSGSGGGVSAYEPLPRYQSAYGLTSAGRSIPDVAANADPNSGYSVYDSTGYNGQKGWFKVGGTSGSTPVWAAIKSLGLSADNGKFYADAKTNYGAYFRDIIVGSNGTYSAGPGYDLVTGLGSPITVTY